MIIVAISLLKAQQDIHVPEVVAAETVVTTALPRRRKQAFPTVVRSGLGSPRVEMVSPSSASDGSASVWSPSVLQVDGSMLSSASNWWVKFNLSISNAND